MSVTSGFFNSLNHDRRYSAQQMSAIFDGIINDGVFANIGVAFKVNADAGVTINIGEGKAWFTSAWVYNDALLPMTLEGSEVVLDRIDAVVIDVDHNDSVRLGSIKVVKGTPSSSPKRPAMASDKKHSQHPLAYIYRKAGSTEITQANITNMVGTSECPYITGILQVQNIDNIVAQWNAQWNEWYAEKVAETDSDASVLLAEMKSEFDSWFADFKSVLDDDVATSLAAQVADLMGKFDTLAKEGAVYDIIEDFDFDVILGSDGTPLQGKTVMGVGGNVDTSGLATKAELNNLGESKVDKANVVNNFITEEEGYVADARALKDLNDNKLAMDLLWKNASPNSDFAAQTIAVDLSSYERVLLEFAWTDKPLIMRIGQPYNANRLNITSTANNTVVIELFKRTFTPSKTGIVVDDCYRTMYAKNNDTFTAVEVNRSPLKPYRIYGLKGVPV